MILLVVGLAAVVVVIGIAVVLSVRLGRGDEQDDHQVPSGNRRAMDPRFAQPASAGRPGRTGPGRESGAGGYGRVPRQDRARYGSRAATRLRDGRSRGDGFADEDFGDGHDDFGEFSDHDFSDFGDEDVTEDYASADHPSRGVLGGDLYPPAEFGAARSGSRRRSGPRQGRKAARPDRRRRDDGDWPTTDWEKLPDEQYWAELSADKPLAAMARPRAAEQGSRGRGAPPAAGRGRRSGAVDRGPGGHTRSAHVPAPASRPLPVPPVRPAAAASRAAPPASRPLPVPPVATSAYPPLPAPPAEAGPGRGGRGFGGDALTDRAIHTGRDALSSRDDVTERLPVHGPSAGPQREDPLTSRSLSWREDPLTSPSPSWREDPLTSPSSSWREDPLTSPSSSWRDDPLTSPSLSWRAVPATDSRSYHNARRSTGAMPGDQAPTPAYGNPYGSYGPGGITRQPPPYQVPPPADPEHSLPPRVLPSDPPGASRPDPYLGGYYQPGPSAGPAPHGVDSYRPGSYRSDEYGDYGYRAGA